jgi:hypothetical protein
MPRQPPTVAERVAAAQRESRTLDFKERFDPNETSECIELIKDIIAMANSGGGLIVIGICDNGKASSANVQPVLDFDPAKLADKIQSYTGVHFVDFEISEAKRGRKRVAVLVIGATPDAPIVFTRPGTYAIEGGKKQQKTVFSKGTVYFRHGAKSEPGTTADLQRALDRRLDKLREQWIDRVRQVVLAPEGARLAMVEAIASDKAGTPTKIRITNDPDAIVYGQLSPDETHPYRQKELLQELNKRLPRGVSVNAHDVLSVRRVHGITEATHPQFTYEPNWSSPQYSEQFVDWLLSRWNANNTFFESAKSRFRVLPV